MGKFRTSAGYFGRGAKTPASTTSLSTVKRLPRYLATPGLTPPAGELHPGFRRYVANTARAGGTLRAHCTGAGCLSAFSLVHHVSSPAHRCEYQPLIANECFDLVFDFLFVHGAHHNPVKARTPPPDTPARLWQVHDFAASRRRRTSSTANEDAKRRKLRALPTLRT